jgi:hypothetical protein
MSALKPENGKYRSSWKTWGAQVVPSKQYKDNYSKISWGKEYKAGDFIMQTKNIGENYFRIKFVKQE